MTKEMSYGFPGWDEIFGKKPKQSKAGAKKSGKQSATSSKAAKKAKKSAKPKR